MPPTDDFIFRGPITGGTGGFSDTEGHVRYRVDLSHDTPRMNVRIRWRR